MDLKDQVNALRYSSNFTAGNAGSFLVPIIKGQIELPGKYDPAVYFDFLELFKLTNIAIVFPGNGGLCVEAIHRGATTVWAIEPRDQYNRVITAVSSFMVTAGKSGFSILTNTNDSKDTTGHGRFDVVVWSEGLDQITDPVLALKNVFSMVKPGGRLFIEVTHGTHEIPKGFINSWKPKEEAFVALLKTLLGDVTLRAMRGRLEKRVIYEITRPLLKSVEVEEKLDKIVVVQSKPSTDIEAIKAEIEKIDQLDLVKPIKRPRIKKIPRIKKNQES